MDVLNLFISFDLKCISRNRHHRDQAMGGGLCSGWSTGEIPRKPGTSEDVPNTAAIKRADAKAPAAYNGCVRRSNSGDQARFAALAATVTTIDTSHKAAIGDKESPLVGTGRTSNRLFL